MAESDDMSGGGLGGATVIGGAVVEISGDLTRLESSEREAKIIAGRIERITADIPVRLGLSEFERQVSQAIRLVDRLRAAGNDLVIVPKIDTSGIERQVQDATRRGGSVGLPGGGSGGTFIDGNAGRGAPLPLGGYGPAGPPAVRALAAGDDGDERPSRKVAGRRQQLKDWDAEASAESTGLARRREASIGRFLPRTGVEDQVGSLVDSIFGGGDDRIGPSMSDGSFIARPNGWEPITNYGRQGPKMAHGRFVDSSRGRSIFSDYGEEVGPRFPNGGFSSREGRRDVIYDYGSDVGPRFPNGAFNSGEGFISDYGGDVGPRLENGNFSSDEPDPRGRRRGGLFSMRGLARHLSGGILAYEGLRLAADYQKNSEDQLLAGNDSMRLYEAQTAQIGSITSIPLIGQAAGLGAEAISSDGVQARAMIQTIGAQEALGQIVSHDHESVLLSHEHHDEVAAHGQFERAKVAATNEYSRIERSAGEEKRTVDAAADAKKQADITQAAAERDTLRYKLASNSAGRDGGYAKDQDDAFAAKKAAAEQAAKITIDAAEAAYKDKIGNAQSNKDIAIAIAGQSKDALLNTLGADNKAIGVQTGAAIAIVAGRPIDALQADRAAERMKLVASLDNEINNKDIDPEVKRKLVEGRGGKLDLFDQQTNNQVMAAERSEGAAVIGYEGQATAAGHDVDAAAALIGHDSRAGLESRLAKTKDAETAAANQAILLAGDNEVVKAAAIKAAEGKLGRLNGDGTFGGGGSVDKQADADRARFAEQQEADTTRIYAQAGADRLRIAHDTFGAELTIFRAEADAKLKLADASQKGAVQAANQAGLALVVAQRQLQIGAEATGASGDVAVAAARLQRDPYTGQLAAYDAESKILHDSKGGFDQVISDIGRKAGRSAIVADQQFEIGMRKEDLDARITAADQNNAGDRIRAGYTPRLRAAFAEVEAASPQLRSKTQDAAIAELESMKHDLTGGHGGGMGAGSNDLGHAQAIVLAARYRGKQEQRIVGDINATETKIRNWNGPPGTAGATNDAKNAQQMIQLLGTIAKLIAGLKSQGGIWNSLPS